MEVEFDDDDLDKLETDAKFSAGFDQAIVKGFRRRMQIIRAAMDERDLRAIKGNRFEKLSGDRKGQWSLMVTGNWRLIVKLVKPQDGKTKVRVIEIVDYHQEKEGDMSTYRMPAEAFPPGDFLREELEARGWTQTEFAKIIGRSARLVNEIIAAKRGVTPETAMDFAAAFGTSAQYWLNLDSAYQLFKAAPANERTARDDRISREARLREKYPVRELVKRGWIEPSENYDVLETRVFSYYNVSSIDDEPCFAHAAKRNYSDDFSQNQLAWLFRVKQMANSIHTPNYTEKKLRSALKELESLTTEPEEARNVPKILAECGVRFVIVEPMPGSKIDGVCFWVNNNKTPVIGLTLLHDRIDNFWFVVRHEIEHVLREDGKQFPILDEAAEGGGLSSNGDSEAEEAANLAAADFCVPQDEMTNFIDRVHPIYSEKKVVGFANRIARHPGLVVGQIHHQTRRYDLLRRHLVKTREIITQSALTDGYGFASPISSQKEITMATYAKQMQKIVTEYRLAGEPWPASTKTIAAWAIQTGRWELEESAAVKKCAEDLARAMREEYTTDSKGRRVRLKHSATIKKNGEQMVLWDDIRTAPRGHMQLAFQQRRHQIFGDCRQLKTDVESYNDNHPGEKPIQMIFDFTLDLEEDDAA